MWPLSFLPMPSGSPTGDDAADWAGWLSRFFPPTANHAPDTAPRERTRGGSAPSPPPTLRRRNYDVWPSPESYVTAHVFGFPSDGAALGCRGDPAAGHVCDPVVRDDVGRQILFAFYPELPDPRHRA
jgi:hypothetical protein